MTKKSKSSKITASKLNIAGMNKIRLAKKPLDTLETRELLTNFQLSCEVDEALSKQLQHYIPINELLLEAAIAIDNQIETTFRAFTEAASKEEIAWNKWEVGEYDKIYKCAHKTKQKFLDIIWVIESTTPPNFAILLSLVYQLGLLVQSFQTLAMAPGAEDKIKNVGKSGDGGSKTRKIFPIDKALIFEWEEQLRPNFKRIQDLHIEIKKRWEAQSNGKSISVSSIEKILSSKMRIEEKNLK